MVGQIQRAAKQTRPDAAYMSCDLSTCVNNATASDYHKANKPFKHMQLRTLISNTGDLESSVSVLYSDLEGMGMAC